MRKGRPAVTALDMTSKQKSIFTFFVKNRSTGQQLSKRIQILLLGSEGHSNAEIKRRLNLSINMIKTWRNRWDLAYDSLSALEQSLESTDYSESDYKSDLLSIVEDLPRSGMPKVFSLAQENAIVALACDQPIVHGVEMTDWTNEMLMKVAIAKKIVSTISESQVRRILKKSPNSSS